MILLASLSPVERRLFDALVAASRLPQDRLDNGDQGAEFRDSQKAMVAGGIKQEEIDAAIERLVDLDLLEYGVSARYGWLTDVGERLRDEMLK